MTHPIAAKTVSIRNLTLSAMMLALCLLLPLLTGQIQTVGQMLLPMHLPVLLCGFLCGWPYGLAVGAIAPLLRSLIFGMPPLMPVAVAMTFELAAYGALSGLFYARFPRNAAGVFLSLVLAMLGGRAVWGLVAIPLYAAKSMPFTFQTFLAGAFISAWPGILAQLVLVPAILLALRRAKLTD